MEEMCDTWKLRGIPEEMLHPSSEFARFLISHAIVQSVSDAVIVAANQLYETKMSLDDSVSLIFEFELSPREAFLFLIQGVPPCAAGKASSPREVPLSNSLSVSFSNAQNSSKRTRVERETESITVQVTQEVELMTSGVAPPLELTMSLTKATTSPDK